MKICMGENFEKIIQNFDYIRMKIQSQGEMLILKIVSEDCQTNDRNQLRACYQISSDAVDFLWSGLPFADLIKMNQDNFLFYQFKLDRNIFQIIIDNFKAYQDSFKALEEEIQNKLQLLFLKIKAYIDDRTNNIIKFY